jgi:hypothetical protein
MLDRNLLAGFAPELHASKTILKLGEFGRWLSERCSETKSATQHAMIQVEADAFANALRKASDERSLLKLERKLDTTRVFDSGTPSECESTSDGASASAGGSVAACEVGVAKRASNEEILEQLANAVDKTIQHSRRNVTEA